MPTPVRVAALLLGLLAMLLLAYATLLLVGRDAMVDQLVARGAVREEAAGSVLLFLVGYAVIGLSAAVSAAFLLRRHPWARVSGLVVSALLTVLMLLSAFTATGATPISLLVLVSAVAALTSLVARPTKQWLARVPSA